MDCFENYGLELFSGSKKRRGELISVLVKKGKLIRGYSGGEYHYLLYGDVDMYARFRRSEDNFANVIDGSYDYEGIDVHGSGSCMWDLVHSGIEITPKESSGLERVIMMKSVDNKGFIPVQLINADIMPSFLKGDRYHVQMVAQPLRIHYYSDNDEYTEKESGQGQKRKFLLGDGSLIPTFFFMNHNPETYIEDKEYSSDRVVEFAGTVKRLAVGHFKLGDNTYNAYIRCIIDTSFGELELNHTFAQVPENEQDNIRIGAVVSGLCFLSGDVAIDGYENGPIKDFEHDLALLRHVLSRGEAERLRSVLLDETIYRTPTNNAEYKGADEIIERMQFVHDNGEPCTVLYGRITEPGGTGYEIGTICLVLSYEGDSGYDSICTIKVDESGMITDIEISRDRGVRFSVDEDESNEDYFDIDEYGEPVDSIFAKAKLNDLLDDYEEPDELLREAEKREDFKANLNKMLNAYEITSRPNLDIAYRNIMSYLFAKAMEQRISELEGRNEELIDYNHEDALYGEINSSLTEDQNKRLLEAMDLGKSFYIDLKMRRELKREGFDFKAMYEQAVLFVQYIGYLSAEQFIKGE